jgi:hypothetical protein
VGEQANTDVPDRTVGAYDLATHARGRLPTEPQVHTFATLAGRDRDRCCTVDRRGRRMKRCAIDLESPVRRDLGAHRRAKAPRGDDLIAEPEADG